MFSAPRYLPTLLLLLMICSSLPASARDWYGRLKDPMGYPCHNIWYGANMMGENEEGVGRGESMVDGLYWMGARQPGIWSIGFTEKDGWPRLFRFGVNVEEKRNIGLHLIYRPNAYVPSSYWYSPWPTEIRQSFTATGSSINQVAFRMAGGEAWVSIHEGDVEPLGRQIGPTRKVPPHPNNRHGGFWSAGLVSTVPGRIYTVRLTSSDPFKETLSPWSQTIKADMSNPIPDGRTWIDGRLVDQPPAITISSDDDGLINTLGTGMAYGHRSGTNLGQTFRARGVHVVGVMFLLGDSGRFAISIHDGVGTNGEGGPQIGPTKYAIGVPWNGRTVVSWMPGEVPVKPGGTYYARIRRVDGERFVLYTTEESPTGSDEYPNGCFYADGTAFPDFDLSGTIVEEESKGSAMLPNVIIGKLSIKAVPDTRSAVIQWATNLPVRGVVQWGTATPYTETASSSTLTRTHRITLTGLEPNKLYHFRVRGTGPDCRETISQDNVFLTLPEKDSNLLTNPGFEKGMAGWTKLGDGDTTSRESGWRKIRGPRTGERALHGAARWASMDDTIYQTVDVITGVRLKAGMYLRTFQKGGNYRYAPDIAWGRLGIDPTGGTDPDSPDIVWSPMTSAHRRYIGVGIEADAASERATVFLQTRMDSAMEWSAFAIDDVVLTQVTDSPR